MFKYPKMKNLFKRQMDKTKPNYGKIIVGEWSRPEFKYLADCEWHWTEKIDGMNIRVIWFNGKLYFKGRTDRAIIPEHLEKRLTEKFSEELFERFGKKHVCLYGEGYGKGIQKGGERYNPNGASFILFDIWIDGYWIERKGVSDIGNALDCIIVPTLGIGTLFEASRITSGGFWSEFGQFCAEGLVLRPLHELCDKNGNRIIAKIKHKDFPHTDPTTDLMRGE
ncbi:MAG: RNA ligase family protein [Candidatus Methanofastidiosia archaeon]|jgi:hypothetical protein